MRLLDYMEKYDYEELVVCVDREVGLKAFIAIHDTTLGPALGGCRIWPHATEEQAIQDVLRLARAMTYKAAAAGLSLGGGKALILADPYKDKTEALLRCFGRFVESLGGRYITTEDVGTTAEDMVHIRQETAYVTGLPLALGGSGDPSEATGFGVYQGMKACARAVFDSESLKGKRVVIQGFGKVASHLAQHLLKEGASLLVTDIREEARRQAREKGIEVLDNPEDIYQVDGDIFSPCALGGVLNSDTIPRLRCKIVAGGANNQLLTEEDGEELHRRGILYAPDFVINAGGLINLSFELGRPYDREAALERVARIYHTMDQVLLLARKEGLSTARAADLLAGKRIAAMRRLKPFYPGMRRSSRWSSMPK